MKTRNSALYALGLAAAITIGSTVSVDAQTRRPTTRRTPATRIPVRKDVPVVTKTDTVYVTRVDTVTVRRADTVTTTMMRYDTVTRMVYPPLAPLPGLFFGIGAGSDIPMNNIRAVVKDSYAFQGQVGYFPSSTSPIGVRADMTWGQLKARETDCPTCSSPKLFTAGGDVILRMPLDRTSKLNPVLYVFGGGGYASLSNVDPRQTAVAGGNGGVNFINSGDLYYDVGPGVDFSLGGLRVYAEGKYMTILSGTATGRTNQSNIHLFPVFAGLKFGF